METRTAARKPAYIAVPPDDYNAISDALYRFAAGQDLRHRALLESAFAEHAMLDFTAVAAKLGVTIPVFEGGQTITDIVWNSTEPLDTTHTVANVRVTAYDGSRASLTALIEAQHLPKDDHTRNLLLKNRLAVELMRDGEAWVIERMVFENAWREGEAGVLFPG
jgi:hypothetical protein